MMITFILIISVILGGIHMFIFLSNFSFFMLVFDSLVQLSLNSHWHWISSYFLSQCTEIYTLINRIHIEQYQIIL